MVTIRECADRLLRIRVRVESSLIVKRLAGGFWWASIGLLLSRGLGLCGAVCVARILGNTKYGELGMLQSTVGMFGVFAGFGLGLTATKFVAEHRQDDPERAGRIIALSSSVAMLTSGVMATVLYLAAPWLADVTMRAPHLAWGIRVSALLLLLSGVNGAQVGALSGLEAFKAIAYVNVGTAIVSLPVLLSGAWLWGVEGAVWAYVFGCAWNWVLNHVALRLETRRCNVPVRYRSCLCESFVLWRFSLPALLGSVVTGPVNWVCGAMLVNQAAGFSEMGVFNAANQWFTILVFLPSMLGSVVLPVLAGQVRHESHSHGLRTLGFAVGANIAFVLPPAIAIAIASPWIMNMYGDEYAQGWPTMIVVAATAVLYSVTNSVGSAIAASGRMWVGLAMNTAWAVVFLASTNILVTDGAVGLASARGIAYFMHAIWGMCYLIVLFRAGAVLKSNANEDYDDRVTEVVSESLP